MDKTSVLAKSLDHVNMIACLLSDVYNALGMAVTPRYAKLTITKIANRAKREGYGFFTKSLPRLGKAFDKALLGQTALDCTGFRKEPGTQIPKMFGNLFKRVFDLNGVVLPNPCVDSIRSLRQILFVYYKYELPNDQTLDQEAIKAFKDAEDDVRQDVEYLSEKFGSLGGRAIPPHTGSLDNHCQMFPGYKEEVALLRRARKLVYDLFAGFSVDGIVPRHGPGVVSTKEKHGGKFVFKRMNPRAQEVFPFDKHMFVNVDHLCDALHSLRDVEIQESEAKVTLVPKDSRGPRVISCEPLENQWLQQGIMRAMVKWIECHPLTRNDIRFTDQEPNRMAAIAGSYHGLLATLDLKEASDRVSVWLVESLFPEPLLGALLATRSLATKLPDGEVLPLRKFAPMGSACCFPVLAVCVWALLRAGRAGADGNTVFVFGDDVIVETAEADHAIEQLETYGLHVNRGKSCTSGFFRESCGMDAYLGVDVTPVRFRTVWSSSSAAGPYESWIAYANSLFDKGYRSSASYIAQKLLAVYGPVPVSAGITMEQYTEEGRTRFRYSCGYPALSFDSIGMLPMPERANRFLQRIERRVRVVASKKIEYPDQDGWVSLLRYFTERCRAADDTLPSYVGQSLVRLAQMSRRSIENTIDSCSPLATNAELTENVDYSILNDVDQAVIAYSSSLTGIPMPVVHECIKRLSMIAIDEAKRQRINSDNWYLKDPPLDPLNVYTITHTAKLRWAWR